MTSAPNGRTSSARSVQEGQGRRACHAMVRHPGDGRAPGRDQRLSRSGRPRRADARSGRMAHVRQTRRSGQHHPASAAAPIAGTEPRRERVAVHAPTTGSPTASSNPTTTSWRSAASHGTTSSTGLGRSCPSECANGPMGEDQCRLVSGRVVNGVFDLLQTGCQSLPSRAFEKCPRGGACSRGTSRRAARSTAVSEAQTALLASGRMSITFSTARPAAWRAARRARPARSFLLDDRKRSPARRWTAEIWTEASGRAPNGRASIPEQRLKGRKQLLDMDMLGLMLCVEVHCAGVALVLERDPRAFPVHRDVLCRRRLQDPRVANAAARPVQIIKRTDPGFVVQLRRRMIEQRTFAHGHASTKRLAEDFQPSAPPRRPCSRWPW